MATIKAIKNALVSEVGAVQYSGDTAFVSVYGHPVESIDGYPVAVCVLSDGDSDFETSAENQRTDIFDIHIIISLEDEGLAIEDAYDRVYDLMDEVRNALDASQDLAGLVLYMNPAAGGINVRELQNGLNVIGLVRVGVRHLYDVTL